MIYDPNGFDFFCSHGWRWRVGLMGFAMFSPFLIWLLSQRWICEFVEADNRNPFGAWLCDQEHTRTVGQWLFDGLIYLIKSLPNLLATAFVIAWLVIGGVFMAIALLGDKPSSSDHDAGTGGRNG